MDLIVRLKKTTFLYILLLTLLIVCSGTLAYASNYFKESTNRGMKAITLQQSETLDVKGLTDAGFNMVLLQVDSVRAVKKPYNTNYHILKQLYRNIQTLEHSGIPYYLCFTSGPGVSKDGKTLSIYQNKAEQAYFAKMTIEVLKRYQSKPHLAGASINLPSASVQEAAYYNIQEQLLTKLSHTNAQLEYMYNLHLLSFEQRLGKLPQPKVRSTVPRLLVNLPIGLTALNYPGVCAGQKSSVTLDKNTLLSALEHLDSYSKDNELPVLLSLRTPWVKNSDVMLQDIYELLKMFKLNLNLADGNSQDRYDFTQNESVMKVIGRHKK